MPEIREATRKVQRRAKEFAPVYPHKAKPPFKKNYVGGSLRESIHTKMYPKQQTGVVYTTLDYAPHQEFGTRYQQGTPFMLPAVNIERAGINQSMKKYIRDELAKQAKK